MSKSMNGLSVLNSYPSDEGRFWSPGVGFKEVYTRSRPFAVLFEAIARRWHTNVGAIAASHPDNWTKPRERNGTNKAGKWDAIGIHCWRPPGNTGIGNLSNHRSGSGMDINGHLHPWKSTPSTDNLSARQKAQIRRIKTDFTDASGRTILSLGIDYPLYEYDPMHIETATGVTEARAVQAAAKLEDYVGRSIHAHVWWREAKGLDVRDFQQWAKNNGFGIKGVDGVAGPNTHDVIRAFQRAAKIEVDGKVGPATRAAMSRYRPAPPPSPTPPARPTPPPAPPPAPPEVKVPDMSAHRIAGGNRIATAAAVSQAGWPNGADAAYLVNSTSSVDQALAATLQDGPVLLVREDSLPGATRLEIVRLSPKRVVAVGGPIQDAVLYEARKTAGLEK